MVWNDFPGCNCLKQILINNGFDTNPALVCLNEDMLNQLENQIHQDNQSIAKVKQICSCDHLKLYEEQENFKFLLGHRAMILKWCEGKNPKQSTSNDSFQINNPAFSPVMREIIRASLLNHNKHPNTRRFSELLMNFSIYIYIMAGKACYEIISANIVLPKAQTIVTHIHNSKDRIIEGDLRCEQLVKHLEQTNSQKKVFLSEDGSGIVKKIVYDSRTNQLIGLVLPFNTTNGMPMPFTFQAQSPETIKRYMEMPQSTLVYIVVAQPLEENGIPFILQIFGTNNTFETDDVLKRWKHTELELKKFGIEVIGNASDGDPRLLRAMKTKVGFDLVPSIEVIKRHNKSTICVQDSIHIGTKLRNRLLDTSILMQIGNVTISIFHIQTLLHILPKEVHGLVFSDICPEDRQNYRSLEKIMNRRVLNALENHVVDAEATIMYLSICQKVTSSFVEKNLEPTERVYRIWYAVYFLRCWRKWIKISKKGYTLTDNFITSNAYTCIEVNAQSIIELIVKLRSTNQHSHFCPPHFSSQPCESMFRKMRSMGTVNFTKINFNLNELFHMIARVEFMNRIIFLCKEIISPRMESKIQEESSTGSSVDPTANLATDLPSNEDILNAMEKAKKEALENAKHFGINFTSADIENCEARLKIWTSDDEDSSESDFSYEESQHPTGTRGSRDENMSTCVDVVNSDGLSETMKKSTFIWTLTESTDKLSSDRRKRVQSSSDTSVSRKRFKSNISWTDPENEKRNLVKSKELQIGEWAIFNIDESKKSQPQQKYFMNKYLIGLVLGFRCINKKKRSVKYKTDYISTCVETSGEKKQIDILAMWYDCNEYGILNLNQSVGKLLVNRDTYVATLKEPTTKKDQLGTNAHVLSSTISQLESELKALIEEE